jgi:hypothetical protein
VNRLQKRCCVIYCVLYSAPKRPASKNANRRKAKVSHYRTLFVNDSEESKEAMEFFRQHKIAVSVALVERSSTEFKPEKLPTLISSEGQWTGPEAVRRYMDNIEKGKKP